MEDMKYYVILIIILIVIILIINRLINKLIVYKIKKYIKAFAEKNSLKIDLLICDYIKDNKQFLCVIMDNYSDIKIKEAVLSGYDNIIRKDILNSILESHKSTIVKTEYFLKILKENTDIIDKVIENRYDTSDRVKTELSKLYTYKINNNKQSMKDLENKYSQEAVDLAQLKDSDTIKDMNPDRLDGKFITGEDMAYRPYDDGNIDPDTDNSVEIVKDSK